MTVARELTGARFPMRSSGFTDPSFARLAELAHLLAGLVFPPNRQPSAEAGMRRAMAALRISDPAALLRATEAPGEARDVVLAELTVGESYFFRDAAQLDLLATEILPSRLESHGANRPLRVWSAGCASGEEPYTIAIMLHELGGRIPRASSAPTSRVSMRRVVRGTRAGRCAAFRRSVSPSGSIAAATTSTSDRSMRESVEFRPLNLVRDQYSSVDAAGTTSCSAAT